MLLLSANENSKTRSLAKRKRRLFLSAGFAIIILFVIQLGFTPTFRAYASIPGTNGTSQSRSSLEVNLTSGQILRVITSSSTNVSVLSLSGGQYDLGLYTSGAKNELLFTPAQLANYTLSLNISSTAGDIVSLSAIGESPTTWTKNITTTGNLILDLTVDVLPEPVSESSGWNPLFGFTGISLGGVTLGSTDVLAIFAAFSLGLMIVGAKKSQKLLYAGLFFLSLIGMIVVGILVVGVIIGSYFAGFLIIRSYFGYRSRRQGM